MPMYLSVATRKLLERALEALPGEGAEALEPFLKGEANLWEAFPEGEPRAFLEGLVRKVYGEMYLPLSSEEVEVWRGKIFLLEKEYALFSLEDGEVGALIPRIPYEGLQATIEEATGFIVQPFLVSPDFFSLLSQAFLAEEREEGGDPAPLGVESERVLLEGEGKGYEATGTRGQRLTHILEPFIQRKRIENPAELPEVDESLARMVPKEMALRLKILPIGEREGQILALAVNPSNLLALDSVHMIFRKRVEPIEVPEMLFQAVLDRVYEQKPLFFQEEEQEEEDKGTTSPSEETEARKFVYRMIREAVYNEVSDIHIEPQRGGVYIRFRVDGTLREWSRLGREGYPPVLSVIKLMSGMDISEKRLPQDGRLRHRLPTGEMADFRVSTVPATYGERVVLRLLRRAEDIPEIENLGFLPDTLEAFKALIERPYGLILITGPTGSGKSFTNFSVLKRIRSPEKNVLTVEDPVEYEIPGISQIQVKANIGLTFARVLRAFLRQDPDVIMIGEIRDTETAKIATEAALTGHLVLATLHTNDAAQAVTRLEEMGVERYNIAASLLGVLSQRLARKLCTCKVPASEEALAFYAKIYEESELSFPQGATFFEPKGCTRCGGVGYKGRIPIHELLVVREATRQAILELKSASALKAHAVAEGMRTLRQDGLLKAAQGLTTVQEVLQRTLE